MSEKKKQECYSIKSMLKERKYFDIIIGERGKGRKYEELRRVNTPKVRR